ncbi:hypothetical protein [Pseudarthrobacter cellobiosi]|uniref:hypothetical protein n=1 Tax=Pseudarthrobacter cellobiosi TaxID=2953654 RepID=UPI00208FEB4F|nr:hypothetical protein [Pseudarthrobacter sp. HLT1-5]MCO4257380.1 hypothetical protein [Pseudarthrobacter sp. HLT1-5]
MIGWFRRRRPAQVPARPDFSERYIAALNGFTPEEWEALPELARKDAREHVAWKMVGA